jgi:hypothetical protein
MGIVVDTAQQQPYDSIAPLTRYLIQRNKPTAREQKAKLTPEGYNALRSKHNLLGDVSLDTLMKGNP